MDMVFFLNEKSYRSSFDFYTKSKYMYLLLEQVDKGFIFLNALLSYDLDFSSDSQALTD